MLKSPKTEILNLMHLFDFFPYHIQVGISNFQKYLYWRPLSYLPFFYKTVMNEYPWLELFYTGSYYADITIFPVKGNEVFIFDTGLSGQVEKYLEIEFWVQNSSHVLERFIIRAEYFVSNAMSKLLDWGAFVKSPEYDVLCNSGVIYEWS